MAWYSNGMDIEKLTKSQIILLTLLVSFVTSIATGIVTVSLMEQAPPAVAQTVNRVVERTVERVVPAGQAATVVTTTERTVVVRESDLIAKGVEKLSPSIVRLYTTTKSAEGKESDVYLGLGIVVTGDGRIVTDVAALPASGAISVALPNGERVRATLSRKSAEIGLALLAGATSTESGAVQWTPAALALKQPSLGETVVSIAGRATTRLASGLVVAQQSGSESAPRLIETNIAADSVQFGSALMNVDGAVVGMSTSVSREAGAGVFLASSDISSYSTRSDESAEE
ncbi:hypothetical protein COU20_03265 [Candidatus Kaiserbacteria bacterium CG10_big_fil_rev_8_21_14_0_10_59_10]|uniref:Serine protease n=1 Tax=Candidatus Kaiserbacteria bacterium CG10_big_fil_rev_8_21_14_0_10_59_10 TaxID=1974612 RepID=A0A2H0U8Z7_9BACT|nr:MAG: hypothetical protein COU20_03265 [Candidatus Kaiserbacteria bacterium CG10_big_fil_rev_8_21_14_0_10_59_10]